MPASDRERGEGFQWVLVRLVTESASEGGEGFQWVLVRLVTESASEGGEGFQLSVGLETLE